MKFSTVRLVLILVSIALLIVAVYAIFHNAIETNSQNSSEVQVTKIRIGYIPIIDCSQIYIASELGHFSENKLDAELVPFSNGAAIIQALSAGAIDVGFANLATVVFYENSSPRLLRLAGGTRMSKGYSEAGLVVVADAGISNFGDLKGKKVAVNSRKNIVDLAVIRAIRLSGLSANDITLVELPFKDMEAALRARRIDAAALPEPLLTAALKAPGLSNLGDHFLIAFGDVYSTGYFAMHNSKKMTPAVIASFNTAISQASSDLKNPSGREYEAVHAVTKLPILLLESSGKPEFVVKVPDAAYEQMRVWLEEEAFLERKQEEKK